MDKGKADDVTYLHFREVSDSVSHTVENAVEVELLRRDVKQGKLHWVV